MSKSPNDLGFLHHIYSSCSFKCSWSYFPPNKVPNTNAPQAFIPSNVRGCLSAQADEPPGCIFGSSPVDPSSSSSCTWGGGQQCRRNPAWPMLGLDPPCTGPPLSWAGTKPYPSPGAPSCTLLRPRGPSAPVLFGSPPLDVPGTKLEGRIATCARWRVYKFNNAGLSLWKHGQSGCPSVQVGYLRGCSTALTHGRLCTHYTVYFAKKQL